MKFSAFGGRSKITTTACIADNQPAQQVRGSVRIGVLPIRGTKAKFLLNSIEELLINDHWIKAGDGRWFYRAVPFTEIVFEHSNICFIAEDPVNMVARKPSSLSGSKPVAVENFSDFFVTNAAVTQVEDSSNHACGSIVDDRSADGAGPLLAFRFSIT